MTFPAAILAQSEIWDEEKRSALKKPKFKKKDLDERRSKVNPTLGLVLEYNK
jgi:ribonuclease P/MRP protein subunit POP1